MSPIILIVNLVGFSSLMSAQCAASSTTSTVWEEFNGERRIATGDTATFIRCLRSNGIEITPVTYTRKGYQYRKNIVHMENTEDELEWHWINDAMRRCGKGLYRQESKLFWFEDSYHNVEREANLWLDLVIAHEGLTIEELKYGGDWVTRYY